MIANILQALKGLFEVTIRKIKINMFNRTVNNTYNIGNGGTLIQVTVPDEKSAEALGKALRGEVGKKPAQIEINGQPFPPIEEPETPK